MSRWYVLLSNHQVARVGSLMAWAEWCAEHDDERIVKQTFQGDDLWVSTVFLGLDHNWGDGPPLLFETMCFRNDSGEECVRSSTWEEAVAKHDDMVRQVYVAAHITPSFSQA